MTSKEPSCHPARPTWLPQGAGSRRIVHRVVARLDKVLQDAELKVADSISWATRKYGDRSMMLGVFAQDSCRSVNGSDLRL